MTTNTFLPALESSYTRPARNISLLNRFMDWCGAQEHDRMLWQGIILSVHACVLTPLALLLGLLAGVDNYLYVPVSVAIAANLITNLAALPTKITIPVFAFSIFIDMGVIAAAVILGMDFSTMA